MKNYKELVQEAKALGINTKGMKAVDIETAINTKTAESVVIVTGETVLDVEQKLEEIAGGADIEIPVSEAGEAETAPVEEVKVERRGRPVLAGSERQKRLASYEAKKAEGLDVKRGRPASETSERQKRLAAIEAKKAEGIEIKRGRPAAPKAEPAGAAVVIPEEVTVEA